MLLTDHVGGRCRVDSKLVRSYLRRTVEEILTSVNNRVDGLTRKSQRIIQLSHLGLHHSGTSRRHSENQNQATIEALRSARCSRAALRRPPTQSAKYQARLIKPLRLGERYTAQRLDAACHRDGAVDLETTVRRQVRITGPGPGSWRRRPELPGTAELSAASPGN